VVFKFTKIEPSGSPLQMSEVYHR